MENYLQIFFKETSIHPWTPVFEHGIGRPAESEVGGFKRSDDKILAVKNALGDYIAEIVDYLTMAGSLPESCASAHIVLSAGGAGNKAHLVLKGSDPGSGIKEILLLLADAYSAALALGGFLSVSYGDESNKYANFRAVYGNHS